MARYARQPTPNPSLSGRGEKKKALAPKRDMTSYPSHAVIASITRLVSSTSRTLTVSIPAALTG